MNGALPPSSSDIRFMPSAHCAISFLPTSVEPVKLSLRTFGCEVIALPMSEAEWPVTMLSTPAGSPARSAMTPSASAEYGVCKAGLQTTVQPAASAGPILRASMADGKFHGVIIATTPTGWRQTMMRLSAAWPGMMSPYMRLASSPNHSRNAAAYATSPLASASGLPCSAVMMVARSSWCSSINSYMRRNTCARSLAVLRAHAGNAACAASMAALVSDAPMSGTVPRRSPLAGLVTSQVALPAWLAPLPVDQALLAQQIGIGKCGECRHGLVRNHVACSR